MRRLFPAKVNGINVPSPIRRDWAFVHTFAVLIALQFFGEWVAHMTRIPIPGPVIGLVALLCLLSASPSLLREMEGASLGLLNHLSLLFIPAGAGVVMLAGALKGQLIAIAIAILVSTGLSIATTALVTVVLLEKRKRAEGDPGASATADRPAQHR
jgi:holin-like protein